MNNKTVILTGNQGFIGAWTTIILKMKGYEIIGIDNQSSLGERIYFDIDLSLKNTIQYNFDITDTSKLKSVVNKHNPVAIINLAGQAIVPRAFKEPLLTFMSNTYGTLSVLESCRDSTVKSAICITSDKVYHNENHIWPLRESDKLGGKDIYSVSKSCAELISSCYATSHTPEINIQTVRLGNVVGGGDWSVNRLIPDFMRAIRDDQVFFIRYSHATRPFQHILDVVDGIINILEASLSNKIDSGDCWNLGPRNNTSAMVSDVINYCNNKWPNIKVKQQEESLQVKEDINLSVDVIKYSRSFTKPNWDSFETIESTINWYYNFFNNHNINDLILNEISLHKGKNNA